MIEILIKTECSSVSVRLWVRKGKRREEGREEGRRKEGGREGEGKDEGRRRKGGGKKEGGRSRKERGGGVVAASHLPLNPSKPASDVLLLLPLYAAWPLLP